MNRLFMLNADMKLIGCNENHGRILSSGPMLPYKLQDFAFPSQEKKNLFLDKIFPFIYIAIINLKKKKSANAYFCETRIAMKLNIAL